MAFNGSDVLVLVNTGTTESPVFVLVGEQRDTTLDVGTGEIDASHKGNTDQALLAGRNTATMTLDALEVPDDAGQAALANAQENREMILVLRQRSGLPVQKALFLITSISQAAPDMDVATFAVSMTRSGSWMSLT